MANTPGQPLVGHERRQALARALKELAPQVADRRYAQGVAARMRYLAEKLAEIPADR